MGEVAVHIEKVRDDPEVQKLLSDTDVVSMIRSGNTVALLGHPGFRQIVNRVASAAR